MLGAHFKLTPVPLLFMLVFVFRFNPTFGQAHKSPCSNYSIEIVDNEIYWDTIFLGLKKKEIIIPPSSLEIVDDSLSQKHLNQIVKEIDCEIKDMNACYKNEMIEKGVPTDFLFEIISITIFKTEGRDRICYVLAETRKLKMQVGVIGIITKGKLITYADRNALELKINLLSAVKDDKAYIVYGKQQGNPDNPYGGHFKLTFSGKKRIIEYEYCEVGG